MKPLAAFWIVINAIAVPAIAHDIDSSLLQGVPNIIDGSTFELGHHAENRIKFTTIRLAGIDAPKLDQLCPNASGEMRHCGLKAAEFLEKSLENHSILCVVRKREINGTTIASCFYAGVTKRKGKEHKQVYDIAIQIILNGFALNDRQNSPDYAAFEDVARKVKWGIHSTGLKRPWRK